MSDTELAKIQERNLRAARLERIRKVNEGMREYYGAIFYARKTARRTANEIGALWIFYKHTAMDENCDELAHMRRRIKEMIAADNKEIAPHVLADFANLRRRVRGQS